MKIGIWAVLMLLLLLCGCAAGRYSSSSYESPPYQERYRYYYDRPWDYYGPATPMQNSPEVLGGLPGVRHLS